MNPEKDKEFEQYINQLVQLLRKIMKHIPHQGKMQGFPGMFKTNKDGSLNMNICFFNFLPISPEDLDELEEYYENQLLGEDKDEELTSELSSSDLEFLKRHGIKF